MRGASFGKSNIILDTSHLAEYTEINFQFDLASYWFINQDSHNFIALKVEKS